MKSKFFPFEAMLPQQPSLMEAALSPTFCRLRIQEMSVCLSESPLQLLNFQKPKLTRHISQQPFRSSNTPDVVILPVPWLVPSFTHDISVWITASTRIPAFITGDFDSHEGNPVNTPATSFLHFSCCNEVLLHLTVQSLYLFTPIAET